MAWLYHPDVSDDPDAQEKFVEVNEAYEWLLNYKTGKLYHEPQKKYKTPARPVKTQEEWRRKQRHEARERAKKHAQMKYREFKKTNYYKNEMALEVIGDNLMFYSLLLFCLAPAIMGIATGNFFGFVLSIIFGALGKPVWQGALKEDSNIRLSLLFSTTFRILNTKVFKVLVMVAFNVLVFCKVVMHTLVSLQISFVLLLVSVVFGYARYSGIVKNNAYTRSLYAYAVCPAVYQMFFVINFMFTANPTIETYRYRLLTSKTYTGHSNQLSIDDLPILRLKDDVYDEYLGIRFLWKPDQMRYGRFVEYHFAEGPLGLRVVQSYKIIQ